MRRFASTAIIGCLAALIMWSSLQSLQKSILHQSLTATFLPARHSALKSSKMRLFDPVRITASELQEKLSTGALSSVQLVEEYTRQIDNHNEYLKAVIVTAPQHVLRQQAERLDEERKAGQVRGPLHGIPILIKVKALHQ
jgi:hypothetical protein